MGSICIDLFMSFDKKKGVTKRNYIIFLEVRVHVVAWIVQVVGIDHRLLLGSTIGSFADQPSALLPINRWLYQL
jgi:hypothetical protein